MVERSFETVTIKYGGVRVKHLNFEGEIIKSKLEYDYYAKRGEAHGVRQWKYIRG